MKKGHHFLGVFVILLGTLAAACSDNGDDITPVDGTVSGPGLAIGPGVTVPEALSSRLDSPLLVNGYLLVRGGEHDNPEQVRLCEALAESFPPQCGGSFLLVEGLGLKSIDGLVSEGPISWTEQPIQLLGVVDGEVLTVGSSSR